MKTLILQNRVGPCNLRTARDWGVVSLALVLIAMAQPVSASTTIYDTPGYLNLGVPLNVSGGSYLLISNAAVIESVRSYVGGGDSNNAAVVTGAGTIWSNTGPLGWVWVGYGGSSNSLSILDGGKVVSTYQGYIGWGASDSGNQVLISGTGSSWQVGGEIDVGGSGSGNLLVVTNGGTLDTTWFFIGRNGGSSSNKVLVSGANSILTNSSSAFMSVGYGGTGNQLVINNGGKVFGAAPATEFRLGQYGDNSSVTVDGTNSTLYVDSNMYIGTGSSGNRMVITNGGYVRSLTGRIGYGTGMTNNSVVISGNGSVWSTPTFLTVGSNTQSSGSGTLLIQDGGTWQGYWMISGFNHSGDITNNGGVFEFTYYLPTVTANSPNSIILTNGVISYKDVAAANIANAQVANITFQGINAFRLNDSTNTPVASYNFATNNGQLYQKLQLVGNGPRWQSTSLNIGSGGEMLVSNTTAATVSGVVTNSGTIRVVNSKVTFENRLLIQGSYISDPSTNTFLDDVTVASSGTLAGTAGNLFDFKKSLFISNTVNSSSLFDLASSTVLFDGGTSGSPVIHTNSITGHDYGNNGTNGFPDGFTAANFSYGRLSLGSTNDYIVFLQGDPSASSNALYVLHLDLLGVTNNVANLDAPAGVNIYYGLPSLAADDAYLMGRSYHLNSGGWLMPAIPEPSSSALLMMAGAVAMGRLLRPRK